MGGEERESPLSAVADGGPQPVSKEVFAAQVLLEQATRPARTWIDQSESLVYTFVFLCCCRSSTSCTPWHSSRELR